MGLETGAEIDSWLQAGAIVVTASDRAARSLIAAFHQRRRAEGLAAWTVPAIHSFNGLVRSQWEARNSDARLLLNVVQEQSIWASILARESLLTTLLEAPRQRLAAFAAEAHALLCSYAARYLDLPARASWDRDAAAFSRWLAAFEAECSRLHVLSPARIPLELIQLLHDDSTLRPPLLIAGFDRLLPAQRALFDAWGNWQQLPSGPPASSVHFYAAADEASEYAACAAWCARTIAAQPSARILVLAQSLAVSRGALERAMLRSLPASAFEFSLGMPLGQVPLARAAHLLLRWLSGSLLETEIDWLLSTGFAAGSEETLALQSCMYSLRLDRRARPQWTLTAFLDQRFAAQLPELWRHRVIDARRQLTSRPRQQTPLEWSALALELLATLGFPGEGRSSSEHQAWQSFQSALEDTGSLAFDGGRVTWTDFLTQLARTLADSLFAPQSHDAPIRIAGPAEAAGLSADALWFLGASEESWPALGSTHPLLPLHVQRESGMPHATAQLDWQLAEATTARVLASAPQAVFSFPQRTADTASRPSRLVVQRSGNPLLLPPEFAPPASSSLQTIEFADSARIPFPHATVSGGAAVLTRQSRCPFQAFATARLGAQSWDPAEFGLTAAQRGQILHAALHSIWAGPPDGLRSLADLLALSDLLSFVTAHVQRALRDELPDGARDRMPARYLELEAERLVTLIAEWLRYESGRVQFTVEQTEAGTTAAVASLVLKLRLDRIDRLADGTLAVIDYKSGADTSKAWDLPRPNDVQLPLYATFALHGETPGGLLFAKLRAGESGFTGRVRNAQDTLFSSLNKRDSLLSKPLTQEQLDEWRSTIEQLARDFLAGRSVVDPRQWPATCQHCGLHSICRIHENRATLEGAEDDEETTDD